MWKCEQERRDLVEKILMILEVSQKQDYIFSSKKLKDNVERSQIIQYVTSNQFFENAAPDLYKESENMIYAGGGHTVLQFATASQAKTFAKTVTAIAIQQFQDLELFVKQIVYDETKTPAENFRQLSAALEAKKALRRSSLRRLKFGIEAEEISSIYNSHVPIESIAPPKGYRFSNEFSQVCGEDSFLAVVHIDGNAMGKRVENLYQSVGEDFDTCCQSLRRFSEGIQSDFEQAFAETAQEVAKCEQNSMYLRMRPIVLAGDDVCFVCAGEIGLECARIFLERLAARKNQEDGLPYAACAGIAVVHAKYPFHEAYGLSEALCNSAKKYSASLDDTGNISAMDFHISFGQLQHSLTDIRGSYRTEDGGFLHLRPLVVVSPQEYHKKDDFFMIRNYNFFKTLCQSLQQDSRTVSRGKLKELRTACKQGQIEADYFLQKESIQNVIDHIWEAEMKQEDIFEMIKSILEHKKQLSKSVFFKVGTEQRCLLFDAIEWMDHYKSIDI